MTDGWGGGGVVQSLCKGCTVHTYIYVSGMYCYCNVPILLEAWSRVLNFAREMYYYISIKHTVLLYAIVCLLPV